MNMVKRGLPSLQSFTFLDRLFTGAAKRLVFQYVVWFRRSNMRIVRIIALVLVSSFCVWAQDAPQTPPPDAQSQAQGNRQFRRGPGTGGTITAIARNPSR